MSVRLQPNHPSDDAKGITASILDGILLGSGDACIGINPVSDDPAVIGRLWQLSTVQFDFTLPRRFGLEYIAEDGKAHQPLMVHRALYGSVERFFGILLEHYAGAFPVWLAPVQAIVLPITDRQSDYARSVRNQLDAAGIRATVDDRSEKVNLKIRDAQLQKIPYMLVVGGREAESGQVAVRHRKHGDQGAKPVADCIAEIGPMLLSISNWENTSMAYVIAEPCIGTKDTACVDACPVDCIHPKKDEAGYAEAELLYIDPVECIDCGACVPVCPVSAIFALDDLPEKWSDFTAKNAAYYGR